MIRARKFEVTIPTVSDVSSIFKIRETGYADLDASDRIELLAGLQTGQLIPLSVPGTSISNLQMIKMRASFSVPGPGWVQYEIEWQQPAVTSTLFSNGVVQDITDQIGATPATARVTLTGTTIPNAIYQLSAQVNLTYQGQTVFKGYVTDIDYSASTGQTGTVVMTLQDLRWYWGGIFIGQKTMLSPYEQKNYFDIIFNQGELPNREFADSGGFAFDRGTTETSAPATRFWTYGDAILALLTWFDPDDLVGGVDAFVASLPHKDDLLQELDCQGQSLLSVLDQLVSAGPEVSWRLDFTSTPVKIVAVKQGGGQLQTFYYRTSVIDQNYATQANVRRSISSSFTDAEIQTSKCIIETHFKGDDHWKSFTPSNDDFLKCFTLKGTALNSIIGGDFGDGRLEDNIPQEFYHSLVTRTDPDTTDPFTAPLSDTDLARASELQPILWASVDGGATYVKVSSNFDIDFKYGRVYLVTPKFDEDGNPLDPTITFISGDVPVTDIDQVKIAMTIAVVADFRKNQTAAFTNSLTRKRTKLVVENKILAEYRMKTRFVDGIGIGSEVEPTLTAYIDPTAKMTEALDRMKISGNADQLSANIVIPFAPVTRPGDQVQLNNFSKWPSETMYVVSQTLSLNKGKFSLSLNCVNQFWQSQNGLMKNPQPTWALAKKIQESFISGASI